VSIGSDARSLSTNARPAIRCFAREAGIVLYLWMVAAAVVARTRHSSSHVHSSFDALSSFDKINLASAFLQAVVALSFAAVQHGVAEHFDRPAMRALAKLWRLLAIAAILNIFSSWSGAVWNNKELSRAINTLVVALLAAGIPYVQLATDALASATRPVRRTTRVAFAWAATALVLHAAGVFGFGAALPNLRVVAVSWSRILKLVVLSVPAQIAWNAYGRAHQHKRALRLLAMGCTALAIRQAISVVLGLRVGMPDLPFAAVVAAITIEVLAIMFFGVMSLLASTAEELSVVQRQSEALVRAEARIASGERMESLGRLAAGVAHDFNNVLQVVRLATSTLRPALAAPNDRAILDDVDVATNHGAALVSQLLTFARQQPQDPKCFDAFDRLRSLTAMLQRVAGRQVDCTVSAANDAAIILMDPAQFEQIAINLVSNARDAIGDDGRIAVRLDVVTVAGDEANRCGNVPAGDYARLTVEDNGHGIPDEIRARIFEPFFTTKETGLGSGLGLPMVHGIVRRAAGTITVDSTPGSGTRFDVYLPALEVVRNKNDDVPKARKTPTSPARLAAVGE
jgi:signal transduction histidine kinase